MNINEVKSSAASAMIAKLRIVEICKNMGFNYNIVVGKSRFKPDVSMRRQVALVMHEEGFSSVAIGKAMNRHHASILHYFGGK